MDDDKDRLREEYEKIISFCDEAGLSEYSEKLKNRLEDLLSPLKIMIVGEGKSGKSTLLNALAGVEIAQVDDEPKTWCINLYSRTEGRPYAELIYPSGKREVSIEEANVVSERISNTDSYESLSEEDRNLSEIRWHTNMEWPPNDIFIVDTPGFNQVRKDTSVETISIDGVDGVRFSSHESFDRYYYKADLVLWCFEATSVGDREVEEHLKSVYRQGKRIYGIVTKLDREEDPEERERIFRENENRYKKYNIVTCIRSGLPTVYDDDDPEEAEEKERIRAESIRGIRQCIEFLLNDDKEAEKIKIENTKKYLDDIKGRLEAVETEFLSFYRDNLDIARKTKEKIEADIKAPLELLENNISYEVDKAFAQLNSQQFLMSVWQQSGSDVDAFAELLSAYFNESEYMTGCRAHWESFITAVSDIKDHRLKDLRWKSITLSIDDPEESPTVTQDIRIDADSYEIRMEDSGFYFDESQMGEIYQFMNIFKKNSTIHQVINILAGDQIRENAFSLATKAMTDNINRTYQSFQTSAAEAIDSIRENIDLIIDKAISDHTGYGYEALPVRIIEFEEILVDLDLFHRDDFTYYPCLSPAGSYPNVKFLGSFYKKELNMEPPEAESGVVDGIQSEYIEPVFEARLKSMEQEISRTLKLYNGGGGITRVHPDGNSYSLTTDPDLLRSFPDVERINWLDTFEKLEEKYQETKEDYIRKVNFFWLDSAKAAEKAIVKVRIAGMTEDLKGEFDRFVSAWEKQIRVDVDDQLKRNLWTALPVSTDYYFYYKNVYVRYCPQEKLIGYIWENAAKGSVPDQYVKTYMYKTVSGKDADSSVKGMVDAVLKLFAQELLKHREQCLQAWKKYFRNYEKFATDTCDRYLDMIKAFLVNNISGSWIDYKAKTDLKKSGSCKTIMEYVVKGKKMPDAFKMIVNGQIQELSPYAGIAMADGSYFKDFWKQYITDKLSEINRELS